MAFVSTNRNGVLLFLVLVGASYISFQIGQMHPKDVQIVPEVEFYEDRALEGAKESTYIGYQKGAPEKLSITKSDPVIQQLENKLIQIREICGEVCDTSSIGVPQSQDEGICSLYEEIDNSVRTGLLLLGCNWNLVRKNFECKALFSDEIHDKDDREILDAALISKQLSPALFDAFSYDRRVAIIPQHILNNYKSMSSRPVKFTQAFVDDYIEKLSESDEKDRV